MGFYSGGQGPAGAVHLTPTYFEKDADGRANLLYHEASHSVQSAFTARSDWEQIVAKVKDPYWGPVESPAYDYQGILSMTDDTWRDVLENPAKAAYYKALVAEAASIGMPTGRIITTAPDGHGGYTHAYHGQEPIPGLTPGTQVPQEWFE
jgi:hypothetical protein